MPTILVVDDEPGVRSVFKALLSEEGYRVLTASDGPTAVATVQRDKPDLLLLDVAMPGGMSGFDVCQKLRELGVKAPILMVTARVTEAEKVIGLSLGADDYITKPFSNMEVLARIKAHLRLVERHTATGPLPELLTVGNMSVDIKRRLVTIEGQEVTLRHKEFELVCALVNNIGLVLTRDQLIQKVWGDDFEGEDRVVDVHIFRVRDALKGFAACPIDIQAVRSVGYRCAIRVTAMSAASTPCRHAFALPEEPADPLPLLLVAARASLAQGQPVCFCGRADLFDRLFSALHAADMRPEELFGQRRLCYAGQSCVDEQGRFSAQMFLDQVRSMFSGARGPGSLVLLDVPGLLGWSTESLPRDEDNICRDVETLEQAAEVLLVEQGPACTVVCCYNLALMTGRLTLHCLKRHPLVAQDQRIQPNSIYRATAPAP